MSQPVNELTVKEISFSLSPEELKEHIPDFEDNLIIGQPRAMKSLELGTELRAKGYNIFVTGQSGTGRRTAVQRVLDKIKPDPSRFRDIAYVYNFQKPESPKTLYFPPGKAREFRKDLHQLIEKLKTLVRNKLDSDQYRKKRDHIVTAVEEQENRVLAEFEQALTKENFQIIHVQENSGNAADIIPVFHGKPSSFEALQGLVAAGKLGEDKWHDIRERYYHHMDTMKRVFSDLRSSRDMMEQELSALQAETVSPDIMREVQMIAQKYEDAAVRAYFSELSRDLAANLFIFTMDQPLKDEFGNPKLIRYGVNIILEHPNVLDKPPIIVEAHPNYSNLFGSIETVFEMSGETRTSFMMISAGSIVKSSGGFIILNAEDLFQEEGSWFHLKRVLQTGRVEIQPSPHPMRLPGPILKPEPIDIDVKVIILGNEHLYDSLYNQDPDFQKYFKVSAEFDSVMPRTDHGIRQYVTFMRRFCEEQGLKPCSDTGICGVIGYGVRLSEHKDRMSTRFAQISELLLEADYWASKLGKEAIDEESVLKALEEKYYRSNMIEEKIDELIRDRIILLTVDGMETGKIKGLAVMDRGYYSFGRPSLITARTAPGNEGVVNIEREVGLSEETHDKGVYIIEGYLRSKYALTFPLSVYASICFEQSYSEIEGDSASSTEIYALLSSVTGLPLRQDLAVTGSVNQMGEIQPVGGITEKVEGFYRTCKLLGLTGSQGVIIPRQNVPHLMVSKEVADAVSAGQFHVYAVSNIDQGMEILSGLEAGERNRKGDFPDNTFNHLVEKNLKSLADKVKAYSGN
ncbi:MAG: ATP-binding protein [Spirochaetales bacterium]|nr:MAG: ATP-binding protein [Spirochaetales bacterium]